MKPKKPRGAPEKVWLIMDPLDGVHVFKSYESAASTLERWKKEAEDDQMDSVWDMIGPLEYHFFC